MLVKDINIFLKKKREKNMVVNDTNIYQKMKNKSWLSIEKHCKIRKKSLIIIIRNDSLFDRFFDRLFFQEIIVNPFISCLGYENID